MNPHSSLSLSSFLPSLTWPEWEAAQALCDLQQSAPNHLQQLDQRVSQAARVLLEIRFPPVRYDGPFRIPAPVLRLPPRGQSTPLPSTTFCSPPARHPSSRVDRPSFGLGAAGQGL